MVSEIFVQFFADILNFCRISPAHIKALKFIVIINNTVVTVEIKAVTSTIKVASAKAISTLGSKVTVTSATTTLNNGYTFAQNFFNSSSAFEAIFKKAGGTKSTTRTEKVVKPTPGAEVTQSDMASILSSIANIGNKSSTLKTSNFKPVITPVTLVVEESGVVADEGTVSSYMKGKPMHGIMARQGAKYIGTASGGGASIAAEEDGYTEITFMDSEGNTITEFPDGKFTYAAYVEGGETYIPIISTTTESFDAAVSEAGLTEAEATEEASITTEIVSDSENGEYVSDEDMKSEYYQLLQSGALNASVANDGSTAKVTFAVKSTDLQSVQTALAVTSGTFTYVPAHTGDTTGGTSTALSDSDSKTTYYPFTLVGFPTLTLSLADTYYVMKLVTASAASATMYSNAVIKLVPGTISITNANTAPTVNSNGTSRPDYEASTADASVGQADFVVVENGVAYNINSDDVKEGTLGEDEDVYIVIKTGSTTGTVTPNLVVWTSSSDQGGTGAATGPGSSSGGCSAAGLSSLALIAVAALLTKKK